MSSHQIRPDQALSVQHMPGRLQASFDLSSRLHTVTSILRSNFILLVNEASRRLILFKLLSSKIESKTPKILIATAQKGVGSDQRGIDVTTALRFRLYVSEAYLISIFIKFVFNASSYFVVESVNFEVEITMYSVSGNVQRIRFIR